MKKNKLLILLVMGFGYYMYSENQKLQKYLRYQGSNNYNQQFRNVSPEPSKRSQQWQEWIKFVYGAFKEVKGLWGPGGPFYNIPKEDIYDVVGEDSILV